MRTILCFLSVLLFASLKPSLASDFKIALVLDKGGKDDRSFNAAAYSGMLRARDELKIQFKYVEATDDNAFESFLRSFAQKNFDLIIAVGISQADAVKKVAPKFPDKKFAIIDANIEALNVVSLLFEEHEGSFLMGAIASKMSKTATIGFIGGMDIPLIRRFEMGYIAGAKKVNPKITVKSNFIGVTGEAWNNPAKAKELAIAQYSAGADIIFAAAGASNGGLFDAAEEKKKLAIGVDSNQNWIKPGFVLTSMLKRVDNAVFSTCQAVVQNKFVPGLKRFGLFNSGIDYSIDQHNESLLPKSVRDLANQLKAEIISGKISVPDFYLNKR
ncbi:MAG: BMP family ABC transporter substrate-binding protein [Candidatus Poribacteria bacterium]